METYNQLLAETIFESAAYQDTYIYIYIYVKLRLINKRIVLRLITEVQCQIIDYFRYVLPGPLDGSPYSLQANKRPPGSKKRHRGLNTSPLGTRPGANFGLLKNPNIRVSVLFLGFRNGKWTPGKTHHSGNNHII